MAGVCICWWLLRLVLRMVLRRLQLARRRVLFMSGVIWGLRRNCGRKQDRGSDRDEACVRLFQGERS
jgi:hypothetical protein